MPRILLVTTVDSLVTPVRARRLMILASTAWAMLLLPFLSALVLTRELDWDMIPAAIAVARGCS